jgi:hypothetical protein
MVAVDDAPEPTALERLWASDPTTPAIVLGKLARFAELQPLIREHPAVYPDLIAWIDAQAEAPSADHAALPEPPRDATSRRRPLWMAVGVAAVTLAAAGITVGIVQPWGSASATADPVADESVDSITPTPTTEITTVAPTAPVDGTVAVPAGANLRAEPSTSAAKIGAYGVGATVQIACFVRGDTISDALGTTDVWYSVGDGYISAAILQASDPDAVVPCDG